MVEVPRAWLSTRKDVVRPRGASKKKKKVASHDLICRRPVQKEKLRDDLNRAASYQR